MTRRKPPSIFDIAYEEYLSGEIFRRVGPFEMWIADFVVVNWHDKEAQGATLALALEAALKKIESAT